MEDFQRELKSVKRELKEVEQQLEELLTKQSGLLERRTELETVLHNDSAKKQQAADTQWDRTDFPWSPELEEKLLSVFGMKELRPMQLQTMNATMSGRDCLLVMPTGGGKSLCFQLPALLSKDAMTDHSATLRLVYVTPEKLAKSKRFMNRLEKMYEMGRFSRLVIDEVHCCSQWGHDFRPDYKFLGIMKRQFPGVPLLGLTATAPLKVLQDVKTILHIPDCLLLRSSFNRPNLYYQVRPKPSSQEEVIRDMSGIICTQFPQQSGIVYCFSQKESAEVARGLQKQGIQSLCYHANLAAKERSRVHRLWASDQIQVVVATVAFGMGIDKPDVRFVIHHTLSKSMENLYQESGRAGRDGNKSCCILYYRFADVARQSTMVFTERTGLENLYSIVAYCTDVTRCRRSRIAHHFGETWDSAQCAGMCDHCDPKVSRPTERRDVTRLCQDVLRILNNASATNQRVTAPKVLDAWYGKGTPTLRIKEVKVPGIARDKAERILAHMLLEGYIREDFHFTAYSTICYLVPGSRAKLLQSGSAQVAMEFESKVPTTKSASIRNGPAKAGKTPTVSGDAGVSVKPVVVNREHSHFSTFISSKKGEEGCAGTSTAGNHSRSSTKPSSATTVSIGKKPRPVISDDESNEAGRERKRREMEDQMDLKDLAFGDDSDLDEPRTKRVKSSGEPRKGRQGGSGRANLLKGSNLNSAGSQSADCSVLDSSHETNTICVSDSDDG